MTQDEFDRVKAAFVRKAKAFQIGEPDPEQWLDGVIGTVILDTVLYIEGTLPLDVLESWS